MRNGLFWAVVIGIPLAGMLAMLSVPVNGTHEGLAEEISVALQEVREMKTRLKSNLELEHRLAAAKHILEFIGPDTTPEENSAEAHEFWQGHVFDDESCWRKLIHDKVIPFGLRRLDAENPPDADELNRLRAEIGAALGDCL